jgi:hypothetical protein
LNLRRSASPHRLGILDANPQGAQVAPLSEAAETGQTERERLAAERRQGSIDVAGLTPVELTQKAQCQVQVFRLDPACLLQAALQGGKTVPEVVGQGQGDEKAHRRASLA